MSKRRRSQADNLRRIRDRLESAGYKVAKPMAAKFGDRAVQAAKSGGSAKEIARAAYPSKWMQREIFRVMTPRLVAAAYAGFEAEALWIGAADSEQAARRIETFSVDDIPPNLEVEPSDEVKAGIARFVRTRRVGLWRNLTASYRGRLERAIIRSIEANDTLDERTDRIRRTLGSRKTTDAAARRIARTEHTGAMNAGQQVEREAEGVEEKEWIATHDMRTRTGRFDHLAADGQVVKVDAHFRVSGERLYYPGDVSAGASAGNVINCRCASAAYL